MNPFRAFRSYLKAVDHHVILTALESRHKTVPLVLNESCFPSHARGERVREIHLVPDHAGGIPRIGKRVGRAAFGVGCPNQLLRRGQGRSGRRRSGRQEKQ